MYHPPSSKGRRDPGITELQAHSKNDSTSDAGQSARNTLRRLSSLRRIGGFQDSFFPLRKIHSSSSLVALSCNVRERINLRPRLIISPENSSRNFLAIRPAPNRPARDPVAPRHRRRKIYNAGCRMYRVTAENRIIPEGVVGSRRRSPRAIVRVWTRRTVRRLV